MRDRGGPSLGRRVLARLRSLARGLFRRSEVDAEVQEEFRLHIELRTEDLIRRGWSPQDASRQAHVEFGHVESLREAARAARGLGPFDQIHFSWVDVKLGLRMLVKHPGLSVVAGFALAVGIPLGMAPVHLSDALEAPLPEDAHDRVRVVRYWDPIAARARHPTQPEFDLWRERSTTFASLGAFRGSFQNVASEDGRAAPVSGAEVTASTFAILARAPRLGRALDAADEVPGAPDVVVLGHDLWQSRFGGDVELVGKSVRLSGVPHTVVGIMPEGFLFPVRQQFWTPLQAQAFTESRGRPGLWVFGRLAEGVSAKEAQAELGATIPALPAEDAPEVRERARVEVVPFGIGYVGLPRSGLPAVPGFYVFQVLALLLLLIACANVAMLVFARTATRLRELAVRNALGASRARIVSQVFTEALVLAVLAAAAGLVGFHWMLKGARAMVLARGLELPYWLTLGVTGQAVVSALLLAVVSAGVAGIVPALRITGRGIRQVIERAGARGPGFRFGGVTGVLIVADVAIAVAVVSVAAVLADRMWDAGNAEALVGIPAEEYLAVQVRLPADETGAATDGASDGAFVERLSSVQQLLLERLEAEPRVRAVAVASGLPRMDQWSRRVEIEGVDSPGPRSGQYMSIALVDVDFFKALNQRMVSGRGFDRGDLDAEVVPVVVNTVFADRMLGGRSPVGRRLRFVRPDDAEEAPWHEIIGVVGHLGMDIVNPQGGEGIYVPAPPGGIHPIQIAIHLGDAPETFAPRLRELAAEIDPTLVLGDPVVLSRVYQGDWYLTNAVAGGLGLLVAVLVALAASGLYAILSFSVSERTKEIGIRTALGASRRSLVLTILRRSLSQVALGALIGMPFAARVFFALRRDAGQGGSTGFSLLAALVVGGLVVGLVGLLSSVVPARRILGIDASAALRAEG